MKTRRFQEMVCTSLLASLFVLFAYVHFVSFQRTHRVSLVFAVTAEALLAGVILIRRSAKDVSFAPAAILTSIGGTVAPLLLRPVSGEDAIPGLVIQVVGTLLAMASILSLNRSFGVLPAHRGIRRTGLYRYIRHPLYCAYTVNEAGYLWNQPSWRNALLVAVGFCCQLWRIHAEERLLSRDPAYIEYARETRWRLLPYVF